MPGFIFGHHERFAGVRKKDMGDEEVQWIIVSFDFFFPIY